MAPYISKNAKGDSTKIVDALAKNGDKTAHEINGTVLTSTFIPSGKKEGDTNQKQWKYDWSSNGTNATTTAAATGNN